MDSCRQWRTCKKPSPVLAEVPKPTGDPNCPEEVKRAKRAKWQINARSDAEDMSDRISEESDGGRATFDDNAEWDKEDEDDEDNQR